MIRGQVARIVSNRQIALNIGTTHGVEAGMRFAIFAPSDSIVDPETGENLGEFRHRKATVVVTTVAERFCFAGPPARNRFLTSLLGGFEEETATSAPDPVLLVDKSQVEPFPTGSAIRKGDRAEQIISAQPKEKSEAPGE